jgi:hypothetical protein
VFFDEKSSGIKLLNASPGLLQDGPFDIIDDTGSPVPFFSIWTGQLNSAPISTRSSTIVLRIDWTIDLCFDWSCLLRLKLFLPLIDLL